MKRGRSQPLVILCIITTIFLMVGCILWNHVQMQWIQNDFVKLLESNQTGYNPHNLIVHDLNEDDANLLAKELSANVRWSALGQFAVLEFEEETELLKAAKDPAVTKYAQNLVLDYYVTLCGTDEDSNGLGSFDVMKEMNIQNTWDTTVGAGVTVAVIDSGIDTDSASFAGRISDWSYNATQDKVVADYG